ncbi:MAG: sulfotransferase, partial [Gammaproteobacteria bacterium]|nr:sulfotransferase [Gammaproteobacteria bacterium]
LQPKSIGIRLDYAKALAMSGDSEAANLEYERLLNLDPNNTDIMLKRAELLERLNDLEAARLWINRAEELLPNRKPEILLRKAMICMRQNQMDEAESLLNLVNRDELNLIADINLSFRLGHIYDRQARFGEALEAYGRANELMIKHRNVKYSREAVIRFASHMRTMFVRDRVDRLLKQAIMPDGSRPEPIFIIGFPRSGTTLVEQILASHPTVRAGDELAAIKELEESIIEQAKRHQDVDASGFRQFYFDFVDELGFLDNDAKWFTDKMPLNATRLGLIKLAFPESPIIHVIRHPLDSCLSCFFTDFAFYNRFSNKFSTLAFHFRNMVEMVDYYRSQMDLKYMSVNYETLVTDPEPTVRKMLEFVGLPWEDRCLEFHKNKRVARTASYAQVNQKLYTSSLYRYKNYREHIQPLVDELGPVIEKLGYSVD